MLRRSEKDSHSPSCSCLLEAYQNFPAEAVVGKGCASPNCPVRTLDGITLHQFLEAIGGPESAGSAAASTDVGEESRSNEYVNAERERIAAAAEQG